jgi:hypothetical protein
MVPLNHSDRFTVSKALLEFSGVDNVGKKQSQQPSTMFALKFFNLCPSLDRDSLQFPGGHEHQSTKVSRWNQWENGSTAGDACSTFGRFGAIGAHAYVTNSGSNSVFNSLRAFNASYPQDKIRQWRCLK